MVLSREGSALSRIELGDEGPRIQRFRLGRKLSSITLSPDGSWAALWNPDGTPLDAGLECFPGAPSDLRMRGERALAVLRALGKVVWFLFPAVLEDPGLLHEADVALSWEGCEEPPCSASPGQARFSAEGEQVYLYTTASPALTAASPTSSWPAASRSARWRQISPRGATIWWSEPRDSTSSSSWQSTPARRGWTSP